MTTRLSFLLLFLAWLAGCGGDPAAGGALLNRGTGEEPESLDVHKSNSTEAGHVLRDLGEGLVGYSPQGELVPAAAASWTVSADGLEYRFSLRPEARWSNGDRVTADDFVYSYRRLVNPATAAVYVASVSDVANAERIMQGQAPVAELGAAAVDPHALVIRLERPVPYFLTLLTHPSMFPVQRAAVEQYGDAHARPGNLVTNGAYRLADWQVGAYIELERNPYYWNDAATAIDRVRHHVTPEPMNELNRYLAGELHVTRTIPPESFAELRATRPGEVRVSPALGVYYFGFNMTRPPFADNPRLREALSMAIDRDTMVDIVGRGEQPAYSLVPDGTAGYSPGRYSWSTLDRDERHRRARQLIREAGYDANHPLVIELRYNTNDTHRQIALAARSMWKDVLGVETRLVNEEFQVFLANLRAKTETEVFRANWNGDYNDAFTFLSIMQSDNPTNFTGYSNPEFEALLDRAARQTSPERRQLYLEEAEREMLADHPLIPVYFYVNKSLVSPRVSGWGDNVLNYHYSHHLSLVP